ncbi:MAG TPA: hypothetical protein VKS60_09980 [Stellaceae bacterium]|nr:hypothetical protein [Stellaceae bacterium]
MAHRAHRLQIVTFGHVDVQTEEGEVIGVVLHAADDDGPVEWQLLPEAARAFMKAVGVYARFDPPEM